MLLDKLKFSAIALVIVAIGVADAVAMGTPRQEPAVIGQQSVVAKALAPLPGRAEIRDALKNWWERMATLQFRERATYRGPDGQPGKGQTAFIVDYAHAPGNRRVVRHGSINPVGAESFRQERRCDGETQTNIDADGKFPPNITLVHIFNQTDTRDRYQGEKSSLLWLIMGTGNDSASRPYYRFIDRGDPLEISRDSAGQPQAVLTINRLGLLIRIELDPAHGWLPRKVGQIATVTRFTQDNGVWFPVEGISHEGDRDQAGTFHVVDLRINRPIRGGRDRFILPPELTNQAVVMDRPRTFGPETLEQARAHPENRRNLEALLAMLATDPHRSGAEAEALDVLREKYIDDPAIAKATRIVSNGMVRYGQDQPVDFVRAVVEQTSNREVRARATLDLARLLWHRAELGMRNTVARRQDARENPKRLFPARGPQIDETKYKSMIAEAERLYRSVIANFADVETLAAAARGDLAEMPTFGVGKVAPEINGDDIDGKPMKLSDYRGKVVLLVFWGDWSPLCRSEYAAVREAVQAAAGKPFVLLGVNSDPDRSAIPQVVRSKKLQGRSWWDGGTNGPIGKTWKVTHWPTIYVLDAQGRIRVMGVLDADITRSVNAILAEMENQK